MIRTLWWKLLKHINLFSKANRSYRIFFYSVPFSSSLCLCCEALFHQISGENVRKLGDGNGSISNEREKSKNSAGEGVRGDRNQHGFQQQETPRLDSRDMDASRSVKTKTLTQIRNSHRNRHQIEQLITGAGDSLKKLEKEKGIVIRFVIGKSGRPGGALDRAIDEEEEVHGDFLRLRHVEDYHQLSTKTRLYFTTAASLWAAEFYVKVDDDVHVNLGK